MRFCRAAFIFALLVSQLALAQEASRIKVIQAVVRTEPWAGWGGGEPLPEELRAQQTPATFTRIPPVENSPPTFSGKVVGLKPGQKAQIGIVSLKGVHWISNDNYEWSGLDSGGSFSVTSAKNLDMRKTLAVKCDSGQWTFLRAEFQPGEGAADIELRIPPAKKVAITMEDHLGNAINFFRGEIFNAYVMHDDDGRPLRPQRFGNATSKQGAMVLELPDEPFGVLLAADSVAPYYEIIDPRQSTHFHFRMIAAGRIRGVVLRDGKPAANEALMLVNDAAPLSATRRRTDANGRFDAPGRVPGIQQISIGDYQSEIELQPGQTAEVKLELSTQAQ